MSDPYSIKNGTATLATSPTPFTFSAVEGGWQDETGRLVLSDPARAYAHVRTSTVMSPVRFKAQFPLDAQIKIQIARGYVPADPANPDVAKATAKAALDILFGLLADLNQAGSDIDVSEPSVQAGLDYLAAASFITTDLAAQIKRGIEVTAA